MNVPPRTITGALHAHNKSACDWGWQSLLAYGCHTSVVVIDTRAVQILQTLEKHKGTVIKTKWARENYHHTIDAPYGLRLASADTNGQIIVWDVSAATDRASFSDGGKPVLDLEWLATQDASHDLLVALHPPYSLVLWNADTGTKLWKKTFTDNIQSMAFDPFDPANLTLLGTDCILFLSDFSISKAPSSNGRKFYITTPNAPSPSSSSNNLGANTPATTPTSDKNSIRPARTALRRVRLLVGDSKQKGSATGEEPDPSMALNECLQLCYLQSRRNHILLVYPREILILDLNIHQTVGTIPMERSGSPFQQVYPCKQRDVLMCLHENGSISVRVRRKALIVASTPSAATTPVDQSFIGLHGDFYWNDPQDVIYDLRCQSDPLRVTKHVRAFGLACCASTERYAALIMSDGRILIWTLMTVEHHSTTVSNSLSHVVLTPLYSPGFSHNYDDFEIVPPPSSGLSNQVQKPTMKTSLADMICQPELKGEVGVQKPDRGILFKFVLTGFTSGIAATPTVIRVCPPLTTKNLHIHKPLVGIGTSVGLVQVFNLATGALWREYNIHTSTVRGIEWVSLCSFLSFSYANPPSSGVTRNELLLLDLQNGKTTQLRAHKGEEAPIEALKVSHQKQYFVVMFKERPFEIWDLRSLSVLREMPANFPVVTALEWSPSHKKRSAHQPLAEMSQSSLDLSGSTQHILDPNEGKSGQPVATKEHFVFSEQSGVLHHFWVEGNLVKEGAKLPSETSLGTITCITWKGETLVLGDVDGNLSIWDLKAKISRNYPTHRSSIKKVKFAPGKGNMKLLFMWNEGIDIWDTKEMQAVSSLKTPKEHNRVIDADWAASDRPVVIGADGCLRVHDIKLRLSCYPTEYTDFPDPVFCPYLLSSKASLAMKYTMQHQPWNSTYTLHLTGEYEAPEEENFIRAVNEQFNIMPQDVKSFLPVCPYGTAQRCLVTARLFGDESEVDFWTVTLFYLKSEKMRLTCPAHKEHKETTGMPQESFQSSTVNSSQTNLHKTPSIDLSHLLDQKGEDMSSCTCVWEPPLDTCFDVLCDNKSFQKYQLDRVSLHDSKRATYEHTMKCAENLILLGQFDRAVQLYLETESENDNYYLNSLQACLVATVKSSGASQSTIKLVATSLIANGRLSEGIQLLCLINKGMDACRYLQTYGQWNQSVWLAKATLNFPECSEVMRRWVDYLCTPQVNQKSKAILVLITLGQFYKVLEMLFSLHYYDRAAMFAEACQEFGVLPDTEEMRTLLEKIYLEYARYLLALGNKKAYGFYCNKAAEKGHKVLQEMEWMSD
ncbi:WD repeat-containing protein 11-like isoform X2 [Amphiura filiformis]|uniref:WD repeat-containing protein 11-like isoform X2 n=1 Tax=Amphiura filiformis TaxID=82378 RepID=UPI003B220AE4